MANFYGSYVGFGSSGGAAPSSHAAGAEKSYQAGGWAPGNVDYITMFTFASHGDTSDIGDLSTAHSYHGGHSSPTEGFVSCNMVNGTDITKFSLPSGTSSSSHGDTNSGSYACGGSSGITHGYTWGGVSNDTIQKFAYASNTTGSDVGNIDDGNRRMKDCADSEVASIAMGGGEPNKYTVQKVLYASDANSSEIGSVANTTAEVIAAHANSMTHCYVAGGGESTKTKNINEMSFASEGASSDSGDLDSTNQWGSGTSSKEGYAYVAGSNISGCYYERYAMASSTSGSVVGSLISPRSGSSCAWHSGHQY